MREPCLELARRLIARRRPAPSPAAPGVVAEIESAVTLVRRHGEQVTDGLHPAQAIAELERAADLWRTGVCPDCPHEECRDAADALVLARAVHALSRLRRLHEGPDLHVVAPPGAAR